MGWIISQVEPWMLGEAEDIFDTQYPDQVVLRLALQYKSETPASEVEMRYYDISGMAELIEQGQEVTIDVPLEVVIYEPGYVYVKWTSINGQRFVRIARISLDTARYIATDGEPDVPDVWEA